MRLRRVQYETNAGNTFEVVNEEDWMVSLRKGQATEGPCFIVPTSQRPCQATCGHQPTEEETRRMLTPFAEKLASRVAEMFNLQDNEQLYLIDELLVVLPNLL